MTAIDDRPAAGALVSPTGYVVSSPEMQYEDRDAWLEQRREGIGSSDIAAICGLDRWTSPLGVYLDKRGEFGKPRTARLDAAGRFGLFVEPFIAQEFATETGYEAIDNPGTLAHVDRPWMRASMDRLLINPKMRHRGPLGPLEMKSRSIYQASDWAHEPPAAPRLQTQWQLGVTGYEFGYIAAMVSNGPVVCYRINRDDKLIADLVRIAEEFWGWIQRGTPPPPDGTAALAELLKVRYAPADAVTEPLVASPLDVDRWLTQREQAKAAIARAEEQVTEAENHLKTIAGSHQEVRVLGETAYTWKWTRHTDVDRQALRDAGLHDQFKKTTPVRRFDIPRGKK